MSEDIEIRSFSIELRSDGVTPPRIEGYAAVFNSPSEEMFGFREVIEPGFFDDVLGDDVRALFNHNRDYVLGRKSNGTLALSQDDKGLRVEIDPPNTAIINDLVLAPMRRGDISQMSFAFTVKPNGDDWREENGQLFRVLKKGGALRLYDVSVVTEPAYPQTSAAVRSKVESLREVPTVREQAESGGSEVRRKASQRKRTLELLTLKR